MITNLRMDLRFKLYVLPTLVRTGGEGEARLVVTGERRVMAGCRGEATTTAVPRASHLLLACS